MKHGKKIRDFLRVYFGLKVIHSQGKVHGITMHVSNIGMWEEKYIGDGRIIKHKPVQDFSGTFKSLRELHRHCKREAGTGDEYGELKQVPILRRVYPEDFINGKCVYCTKGENYHEDINGSTYCKEFVR